MSYIAGVISILCTFSMHIFDVNRAANPSVFWKIAPEGFKCCFDMLRRMSSTRAFDSSGQIEKRSIGCRAMVVLLQQKNFGPNVIYNVSISLCSDNRLPEKAEKSKRTKKIPPNP